MFWTRISRVDARLKPCKGLNPVDLSVEIAGCYKGIQSLDPVGRQPSQVGLSRNCKKQRVLHKNHRNATVLYAQGLSKLAFTHFAQECSILPIIVCNLCNSAQVPFPSIFQHNSHLTTRFSRYLAPSLTAFTGKIIVKPPARANKACT